MPRPAWPLALFAAAVIIWGVVAMKDIYAQRRTGRRALPAYGERDEA